MNDHHGANTSTLEDLVKDAIVDGIEPSGPVAVISVAWHGDQAVTLTYRDQTNQVREQLLYRTDEGTFSVHAGTQRAWSFDGDGDAFRAAAEAYRIRLAHLFDPYMALASSEVEPLPHQIEAVYGEMLARQPLRFLLADDPGAGKTIMAGLYIKELIIRGDAERILIVAPGSLVNQWQDELWDKFGLLFDVVTKEMLDGGHVRDVFQDQHRLICRVDQISRREDLVERLAQTDWDLVVVDEAHRMSAHFFNGEVRKTKKYQLGETLGAIARHFLLMTATPHAGKEEDFQLFLALLDSDRFEGRFRDGVRSVDPSDLMRRMVKEKLLTFEGRRLFPERRATTVDYELSAPEMTLYDEVTAYVRDQMNRAERLSRDGQGQRENTVGFALTILQRRLASSPEAIYQSLVRRRKRLENRVVEERQLVRSASLGMSPQEERLSSLLDEADEMFDPSVWDDVAGNERETLEMAVADAATAAETVAELEIEIEILKQLEALALELRGQGVDAKWVQMERLLSHDEAMFKPDGSRRKLLIFTEHRDTMNYLVDRLRRFLGDPNAVVCISGSTSRDERRAIQARFTQDEECLMLVATDAAGEGINLQRAHLVINYDLPWNPNRIEQRFGRVHRIGQTEVCHMWNLVAAETREAQVYRRLLDKIEQQRAAYKGQVFDVLGEALSEAELSRLMVDAIRYGDDPEVRSRIEQIIDGEVGERIRSAIEQPPLAEETMAFAAVGDLRSEMQSESAQRLQPFHVGAFFLRAFAELGGKVDEKEPGRFQVAAVPASVRQRDRQTGAGAPVLARYERVVFDKALVQFHGRPNAELLTPGHPLLDATIDLVLERQRNLFKCGSILVDDRDNPHNHAPRVLVMLEHAIADARATRNQPHTVVSRRFEFVEIDPDGVASDAGAAPYLDYRAMREGEFDAIKALLDDEWLQSDLEQIGKNYAITEAVPQHLAEVRSRTEDRVDATLDAVKDRLTQEITHWDHRAMELQRRVESGSAHHANVEPARKRSEELALRLERRVAELEAERSLRPLPPTVVGGALIVPGRMLSAGLAAAPAGRAADAGDMEFRARVVDGVIGIERQLGRDAVVGEGPSATRSWDLRSRRPTTDDEELGETLLINVKYRSGGTTHVVFGRNELVTAFNAPESLVVALVDIAPGGGAAVRYLRRPFDGVVNPFRFEVSTIRLEWTDLWNRAERPS